MRYFVVFRLSDSIETRKITPELKCRWCDSEASRHEAEELSRFQAADFESPVSATAAVLDGDVVGACWISSDFFVESDLGIRIELEQSQRWLFGAMVNGGYRGRGIFPQLMKFTCDDISVRDNAVVYASVNPFNKASFAVFDRYSTPERGRAVVIRFLNWNWCIAGGICRADKLFSGDAKKKPIQLKLVS